MKGGTDFDGSKTFISTVADQRSMVAFAANAAVIAGLFGAIAIGRHGRRGGRLRGAALTVLGWQPPYQQPSSRAPRTFRIDRVSSVELTDDPAQRPEGFDLAETWREMADEVDRKRTPRETRAVCASDGIGLLRMILGCRLEVGGSTPDGRIEIVIRGHNEYALAGELAGLIEWLEVTGPQGVRDHLASMGGALVARSG